jgi:hypothetical protein
VCIACLATAGFFATRCLPPDAYRGDATGGGDAGATPDASYDGCAPQLFATEDAGTTFSLEETFGDTAPQAATGIATDPAGNTYLAGNFETGATFGSGFVLDGGSAKQWSFVIKLDAGGNVLWARRFGGDTSDTQTVSVTADLGGVTFAGTFGCSPGTSGCAAGFDPPGPAAVMSAGGHDVFVAKLDAAGNPRWARAFGDASDQQTATAIASVPSGGVVVVGNYVGTLDFGTTSLKSEYDDAAPVRSAFAARLGPDDGLTVWARDIGVGAMDADALHRVALDGAGDAFLTGPCTGSAIFDASAGTEACSGIYALKLDPEGQPVWHRIFTTGTVDVHEIAVDDPGNVYLAHTFYGHLKFGGCAAPLYGPTSNNWNDLAVAKLDADGNATWARQFGVTDTPHFAEGLAVDGDRGVLLAGVLRGSLDVGVELDAPTGALFVLALDPAGGHRYSRTLPTTFTGLVMVQQGIRIAAGSGAALLAGWFTQDLTLGQVHASAGQTDVFFAKLDPIGP